MTTEMHAPSARPTRRAALARRLVAVGALAPLLAVAACSGEDPITARTAIGTSAATQAGTGAPTGTATSESSGATTPQASATTKPLKLVINDNDLGHVAVAEKLVRNVPWPSGHPVGQASFEIIAVQISWRAGARYSASLDPSMLSLATSKATQAQPTPEFGTLLGPALRAVPRGQGATGWVYFKVDRSSGSRVSLSLQRPAYKVSTTGKTFPRRTFTVLLSS